jgi:hypothetical protein
MAKVAQSVGTQLVRLPGLTRQASGQQGPLPPEAFGQAFSAPKGGVFAAGGGGPFVFIVGRVDAIRPPTVAENARAVEQVRPQLGMTLFSEIGAQMPRYARTVLKTRTDPELARQTLGIEAPKAKEAKDGKGAAGK